MMMALAQGISNSVNTISWAMPGISSTPNNFLQERNFYSTEKFVLEDRN